jgi:hypothetical protein
MCVPPMIAVRRDFGRYTDRTSNSGAIFFSDEHEERSALVKSTGVPVDGAGYLTHGRDADATGERSLLSFAAFVGILNKWQMSEGSGWRLMLLHHTGGALFAE